MIMSNGKNVPVIIGESNYKTKKPNLLEYDMRYLAN